VNIISSRRLSGLALSLLVAAVAPAACGVDAREPSPQEQVSSAKQADVAVAHEWLFAETGGTTTSDAVSTGAVTGTLGASASLGGRSVTLSADAGYDPDSYVDFGTSAAEFGTSDFTVAHWYKTTFGGGGILGDLLGNRVDSSHGQFLSARINGSGFITFEVDEDGNGTNYAFAGTGTPVNDGAWHHVAFVRQGATVTIYVDGAVSGSGSADSGQPANVAGDGSASFRVGRRLGDCCGNFLSVPGSYADLRIYDSALGASDIGGIIAQSSTCALDTYDCTGSPVNGCQSTVPCDVGGHCTDGSGCASGVCSGGACQEVETWQCTSNCYDIDVACRDPQGDALDACIDACASDSSCLDGCYAAFFAATAQCDASVPACSAVCNGSCSDGVQDDGETGVDCGGPCAACPM
jgi:hypothetical protein